MPIIINSAYQSYKEDFMTWAADACRQVRLPRRNQAKIKEMQGA